MRTVLPNSDQVAHVWAHQSQDHARNSGGSTSFRGPKFYSYRTPIARITGEAVLISSNTYSATTASRHLPAVRNAVRGLFPSAYIFTVPFVVEQAEGRAPGGTMDDNLIALESAYHALCARLLRVQSAYWTTRADVYSSLEESFKTCQTFARLFGLKGNKLEIDRDADNIWARWERLERKRAQPGYIAKREAANDRAKVRKVEREREKVAALKQAACDRVAQWLAGGRVTLAYGDAKTAGYEGHLLRNVPNSGPDTVQTSGGARVPLADAVRVLELYGTVRREGIRYIPHPVMRTKIGAFALDEITAEGDVRVGCHFFKAQEIVRFAATVGVAL